MAISTFSRDEFIDVIKGCLSPASPIQSAEYLMGRKKQLQLIDESLSSSGRNVFIYGDRGVGKTSLAHTAAYEHQTSSKEPIILSCSKNTNFYNIAENIARGLINDPIGRNYTSVHRTTIGLPKIIGHEEEVRSSGISIPKIDDLTSAVHIIKNLSSLNAGKNLVIIDEFDKMKNPDDHELFADFIKQIGDQKLNIQLIICGIGKSLDDLLTAHGSCYRYLANIELERLNFGARFEIIDISASKLGIELPERARFRIAAISDGFPHYVHLVCEKLYWEVFNDPEICHKTTPEHYSGAIQSSIMGIQQQLKKAYEKATLRTTDDYQEILWAVADHSDLFRHIDSIYGDSYLRIMEQLEKTPLERDQFVARLNTLKTSSCGSILTSRRRKWVEFRETVVRGYVRLRAEGEGIELALDYAPAKTFVDPSVVKIRGKRYVDWRKVGQKPRK